ncbi:MAG: hypothetical protein AB3N13_16455 [Arenibacterium sp.]
MLELFLLLFSGAVLAAAGAGAPPPPSQTTLTAIPQIAAPETAEPAAPAAPVFLAPKTEEAAPPAFLQPQTPALVAEPQIATGRFLTALEVKPILSATKTNWISVREFNGKDLVYVTHLWSWRCGLLQMKVGINGQPVEVWDLPDCHEDQPAAAAILESDGLPYREFPLGSVQQIAVELTYDDLSTDAVRVTRLGTIIP